MHKLLLLASLFALSTGCALLPGGRDDDDDDDDDDEESCATGFVRGPDGNCYRVPEEDTDTTGPSQGGSTTSSSTTSSTSESDTATPATDTWAPAYLWVQVQFGWDATSDQFVDFSYDGLNYPAAVLYHLGSASWDFSLWSTDEYCTVTVPLANAVVDPSPDPAFWWGFTQVGGQGATDDCAGEIAPGDPWENPASILDVSHGVYLGDLDPYVEDVIVDALGADYVSSFFGNTFESDGIGGPTTHFYMSAYPVDPAFELVDDGSGVVVPYEAAQVPVGQEVRTAAYIGYTFAYGL